MLHHAPWHEVALGPIFSRRRACAMIVFVFVCVWYVRRAKRFGRPNRVVLFSSSIYFRNISSAEDDDGARVGHVRARDGALLLALLLLEVGAADGLVELALLPQAAPRRRVGSRPCAPGRAARPASPPPTGRARAWQRARRARCTRRRARWRARRRAPPPPRRARPPRTRRPPWHPGTTQRVTGGTSTMRRSDGTRSWSSAAAQPSDASSRSISWVSSNSVDRLTPRRRSSSSILRARRGVPSGKTSCASRTAASSSSERSGCSCRPSTEASFSSAASAAQAPDILEGAVGSAHCWHSSASGTSASVLSCCCASTSSISMTVDSNNAIATSVKRQHPLPSYEFPRPTRLAWRRLGGG